MCSTFRTHNRLADRADPSVKRPKRADGTDRISVLPRAMSLGHKRRPGGDGFRDGGEVDPFLI